MNTPNSNMNSGGLELRQRIEGGRKPEVEWSRVMPPVTGVGTDDEFSLRRQQRVAFDECSVADRKGLSRTPSGIHHREESHPCKRDKGGITGCSTPPTQDHDHST